MPPEPLPWDRRDFVFREKKHDRAAPYPDALGSGGSSSITRWREPYHATREFPTPSPRRPPSGYYRHGGGGGYHNLFPDEPCSRSEDDGFRPYQSGRYGGGSNRTSYSRDGGGYFRRSSWDSGDLPRQHHDSIASQRSVADPLSHPSSHLIPFEDHHDKTGGGVDDGSRTGHKHDRDPDHSLGSLQWKPLKWNRSGSFSSSSKTVRSESDEGTLEVVVPHGKEALAESPVASPLSLDEGLPRKKPRLGWGQGLAKYEKQKIEGTEDGGGKNSPIQCGNVARVSFSDASPKLAELRGSASPATPASLTCRSSQGGEDKCSIKVPNNDASINLSDLPCPDSQLCLENFSINGEHLDLGSFSDVSSLLADLLHSEDACSTGSHFMRQTSLSRLLLLKDIILKQLEKTESDVDSFENELKKLNSECEVSHPRQRSGRVNSECKENDSGSRSSAMPIDNMSESPEHASVVTRDFCYSISVLAPAVASSAGKGLLGEHEEANEQGDFSPNAVESEFLDSTSRVKKASESDYLKAAVLGTGSSSAMSDVDHQFPSIIGNEPAVNDVDGVLDVRICRNDYSTVNSGQECSSLTASIMAFNRESAKRASEVLDIPYPINSSSLHAVSSCNNLLDKQKEVQIRSKLAMCKHLSRFKERALTLKYRAFQHLWKEDLHLLSIRKHRSKPQKRFDLTCRSLQNASQKNRSQRSRFALSRNPTLVPTSEILDFTSKMLSDSRIKLYRSNLRMPTLILDEREKKYSRFITNNRLIEDPCSFEKERSMINPWTSEECEIFLQMLGMYGKNFSKIASFLSHKATADCIEFYYRNHKSESFEKVKKSLGLRKNHQAIPSNNYLLTSGKKWKREINAASLDVLGTASMLASQADNNMQVQHRFSGKSIFGGHSDIRIPHGNSAAFETSSNGGILGHEQETSAADALIGICGALSSEAMSSCITTSFDPGEKMNYVAVDGHLTFEVSQIVDEDTCSDEVDGELVSIDWTDKEKSDFLSALSSHGRDFVRISHCVGSRSKEQCKIFYSKARKCLGLDAILQGTLSDANIGKSDTEDACMFEIDSAMCSTHSCSKMEVVTHSTANDIVAASVEAADAPLQIDQDKYSERHEIMASSLKTMMERLAPNDDSALSPEENHCLKVSEGKTLFINLKPGVSMQLDKFADKHPGTGENYGNVPVEFPGGSAASRDGVRVEGIDSCASSELLLGVVEKGMPGDCFKAELELTKIPVPKRDGKQQSETNSQGENIMMSSPFVSESNVNGGARLPDDRLNACPKVVFASFYMNPLDLLPGLDERHQFVSRGQKVNSTLPVSPFVSQPFSVHYVDPSHAVPSKSAFNFEDHGNKQQRISTSKDVYQSYLSGKQSSVGQSAPILRSYPLQVLQKQELNGQARAVCEGSVLQPDCQDKGADAQPVQDSRGENRICHQPQLGPVIPFLPNDGEQPDIELRPCVHSSLIVKSEEQFARTGDVKLFGQILSHPSPVQNPNSPARCGNTKPPISSQTSSLNLLNGHSDGTPESCRQPSRQEVHGRNYGVWGEGCMQRDLSAVVPESGMFLAKYSGSSLSCYTVKDHTGTCGFVQQAYMQPLTPDGSRSDVSLDLQKHSGFERVSGVQHQGQHQGRVSLGRAAGSSVLVSSTGCTSVSDPVVALKMHFAARTGVLGSEDESWRADIGR